MASLRDATPESPAPVRAVANALQGWIDRLGTVWVEGQLAQINRRSGINTVFLTLRDPVADLSVNATMARTLFDSLNPPLVEGAKIIALAKPSYFPARGSLSLSIREVRLSGLGDLLARLEQRRQLLAAEGLFAPDLKRRLPFLPRRVGLITAPGSAAERDVLERARARWPAVRFEVAPATVQGPRATQEVMDALARLDRLDEVDVIVIARGGGSVEDLLPFSDEALIRAVHRARTPIVSAIGHEQDSPLLDLVADERASTPTHAASLIVPDMADEMRGISWARDRLRDLVTTRLHQEQQGLSALRSRPVLAAPLSLIDGRRDEVTGLIDRARRQVGHRLDRAVDDLEHQRARARALSPLQTLKRGYAVVQTADGGVLTCVRDLAVDDTVSIRLSDGRLGATVTTLDPDDASGGSNG
ncbi:MAG: exodeoxyribonuclease VII large subunit [Nocardioides sp.]|jgi:exodeoxyribonuclease VII large subunit